VVGVHIAGPDAPEMIQLAAVAGGRADKAQWDSTWRAAPTAAEELVTLRDKAATRLRAEFDAWACAGLRRGFQSEPSG